MHNSASAMTLSFSSTSENPPSFENGIECASRYFIVDGAVGHGEHFVLAGSGGTDHDEAGRDDLVAWLGLDELQRGTDRVGRGVGSAAEQAVGLAHLDEHGAEVVALLERCARAR